MTANYVPTYTFFGDLQVDSAGSDNKSVARRADIPGLSYITSIAADSQSLLSVSGGALSVNSLLVTDVFVDTTYTTLAALVAASAIPSGCKTGDVLILQAANPSLSYICKVASPSAASDFAQLNEAQTYSAGDGLDLSGSVFSVDLPSSNPGLEIVSGELDVKLDAGGGMLSGPGGLEVKLDGSTLSKSSSGIKVSAISNAEVSNSAAIAQSKLALAITDSEVASGAAIAQNKLALDITNAQVNASAAIAQSKLDLAITNAEVSNSAAIAMSKLDLAITNAEVSNSAAIAQSKLALDITNAQVNASAAIAMSKLDLAITDSEIAVGAAISQSKIAGLRYEATNQTLTANTALTINHNLGKKVVHVTAMRTSDSKMVEVEVTYTNTNSLSIKSVSGLTVDLAISI